MQKSYQKYPFTRKPPNATFRCRLYFLAQPSWKGTHRIVGYQTLRRTHLLPSKFDQMKVSHETGSKANFRFRRALMPLKAAFFSFRMQPGSACPVQWLKFGRNCKSSMCILFCAVSNFIFDKLLFALFML